MSKHKWIKITEEEHDRLRRAEAAFAEHLLAGGRSRHFPVSVSATSDEQNFCKVACVCGSDYTVLVPRDNVVRFGKCPMDYENPTGYPEWVDEPKKDITGHGKTLQEAAEDLYTKNVEAPTFEWSDPLWQSPMSEDPNKTPDFQAALNDMTEQMRANMPIVLDGIRKFLTDIENAAKKRS